ncbi:MAG: peptide chain release factor N(5)-glutamine methyltransferase [Acidimicrobiales bacterium]
MIVASADGTIAWGVLLREATDRVGEVAARCIVEECTGAPPGGLHRVLDDPATVRGVGRFDALVARRERGEPLQYVLGHWSFRELDLMVDARVLIPRPETETVAGLAIDEVRARSRGSRDVLVVDLGTGTGAIGLSVAAECPSARVMATDVSVDALAVASANLTGLGRAATRVSLHHGHWFAALPESSRHMIDVIVSNPPYVGDHEDLPAIVADWEPAGALRSGPDGLDDIAQIVDQAGDWLAAAGSLVIEMAPTQTAVVARWCEDRGFSASIHRDLAGRERAVVARRVP